MAEKQSQFLLIREGGGGDTAATAGKQSQPLLISEDGGRDTAAAPGNKAKLATRPLPLATRPLPYIMLTGSMSIITDCGGIPCRSHSSASRRRASWRRARELAFS